MRPAGRDHAPINPTYTKSRSVFAASIAAAAALAAFLVSGDTPTFAEMGPFETAQLAIWIGAALFALVLAIPQRAFADRAAMISVGTAALAAAAREIDAHVLLNPETIGDLGVRYRIDWWLDASVPILKKLAWAAIALVAAAIAVAATLAAHFRPILAVKRRNRAVIYLAASAACMALGLTFDDLLRGRIPLPTSQAAEESFELLAPIFYLAAANHLAVSSLTGARRALHRHATGTLIPCPTQPPSSQSQPSTSTASPNASPGSTTSTRPASATASAPS